MDSSNHGLLDLTMPTRAGPEQSRPWPGIHSACTLHLVHSDGAPGHLGAFGGEESEPNGLVCRSSHTGCRLSLAASIKSD